MSVADKILALQNDSAAIASAISAKGVTVPAGSGYDDYASLIASIPTQSAPNLQDKTVSPTTSQQTVQADNGYDGLDTVTVNAIQTETKSATPTTSQQNIDATSGKYMTRVTVGAIQTETKNATPSTSSQDITPSSGKFLTKVTVGAVSAAIDSNIQAGNIKSGVNILGVTGTYAGSSGATLTPLAGDYPVVANGGIGGGGNNLTSTGISVTIPVTGTYRFKWVAFRRANSTGYTWASRLYRTRNNTTEAIGSQNSTWTSTYYQVNSQDIACNAGDVITVYVAGRSNSYSWGGMLTACVNQKMWTN